jgi:transposase
MDNITTLGIDLAKSVFQLHGVGADGRVLQRRQLRRSQMLEFFQRLPPCLIGMEACASAHYWARELAKFGHEVRLMQPSYVKGYVKRGKTDAADAEAICEAVSRPSMRFVPVKSEDTQALLLTHKAREFLVRQQTQIVNAMRAHLGEFGIVVPKGIHNVERLIMACEQAELPAPARKAMSLLADQLIDTQKKIEDLTADIRADARANEDAQRLQTIPGIGPITASALVSALPDIADFASGRDLSAWLGLTPRPHSTGGKERLGRISKSELVNATRPRERANQQVPAQAALPGCHRASQRAPTGRGRGRLAMEDHPTQETKAGRDRAGEPHGPHRLCADEEQDHVPGGASRLTKTGAPCPTKKASAS